MIKKLSKHGNSVVIDNVVLNLLNIDEDTPLSISTDGERLVITPVRKSKKNQKLVDKALADTDERYGKMLKRLVE